MTMMTGFDMREVDLLDEEYLGPPPRFLLEDRPADFDELEFSRTSETGSAFDRLKSFLGIGTA
jgi:hypothetical protein